jgi:hypothetical protein
MVPLSVLKHNRTAQCVLIWLSEVDAVFWLYHHRVIIAELILFFTERFGTAVSLLTPLHDVPDVNTGKGLSFVTEGMRSSVDRYWDCNFKVILVHFLPVSEMCH